MSTSEGHRERLRQKFKENPQSLSDTERLELLLTYIIPRKDVAPLAHALIAHFGSLQAVIAAPSELLLGIDGVGESTITFSKLVQSIMAESSEISNNMSLAKQNTPSPQLNLFELEPKMGTTSSTGYPAKKKTAIKERQMRVFANDEIVNSLTFLPQVEKFQSLDDFKKYLLEKLPYNAVETRQRRANHIIERFYPDNDIDTPLTYFVTRCSAEVDLKPAVFYHILKAEPIATKVADEFIWPALPVGYIEREQLREFVVRYLPDAGASSQRNMLRALFYTYDLLGIGSANGTILRFQLHKGTLESFLYILTSEFSQPGIYPFDLLYKGPLHKWLLWDREWMRMQLYNLQDFGILSKVAEIDTVRQFTLAVDQPMALRLFFEHPERNQMTIREQAESQTTDQEK
jgi:DNA repair protein RadC